MTDWEVSQMQGKGSSFGTHGGKYAKSDRGDALLRNTKNPGPGAYNPSQIGG